MTGHGRNMIHIMVIYIYLSVEIHEYLMYKYTRIYTYCCPACLLSSLCCLNNLELFNNSSSSSFHRKCIKTPKYALFLWLVSEIHAMFTKLGNYAVAVNAQNILGQRKNRRREG